MKKIHQFLPVWIIHSESVNKKKLQQLLFHISAKQLQAALEFLKGKCWQCQFMMAPLSSDAVQVAPLRLCFYLLFYLLLLSLFTHITSALITYDRGTLLDIEHRYTNLFQDTLSSNPSWPLEILQNAEVNNGHLNNHLNRQRIKKGFHNRLRKRAHSPPLPSILLTNVQSLENKMDDLRARISFQWDITDCNILCLSETWLTTSVPESAVTPSDNFFVFRPLWMQSRQPDSARFGGN